MSTKPTFRERWNAFWKAFWELLTGGESRLEPLEPIKSVPVEQVLPEAAKTDQSPAATPKPHKASMGSILRGDKQPLTVGVEPPVLAALTVVRKAPAAETPVENVAGNGASLSPLPKVTTTSSAPAGKRLQSEWRPKCPSFVPHQFDMQIGVGKMRLEIMISENAFDKMMHYVDMAEQEVGWLGTVTILPSGKFLIMDVYLLDQDVHATTTKISAEGLAQFVQENSHDPNVWTNTAFWGHSHVNMGTSPSGQDDAQMEEFKGSGHDWFIRGIFNKRGRAQFSIYFYKQGIEVHDVPWVRIDDVDPDLLEQTREEFRKKVRSRSFGI